MGNVSLSQLMDSRHWDFKGLDEQLASTVQQLKEVVSQS
jgi:hypothetical protein